MGGTSTTSTTQQSETQPWQPAQPFLTGVLGQLQGQLPGVNLTGTETGALNTIEQNAGLANQYAPQFGGVLSNLLGGGGATAQAGNLQSNLDTLRSQLTPYATGAMGGSNSALKAQLDSIASDVANQVNGQFAAAGRDLSGMNQQALARGIAQGEAPVLANQYNQDVQTQLAAANQLYGAGNSTAGLLSGLNQQATTNQLAGLNAAPNVLAAQNAGANAALAAEAQRRGIPMQALALLANIGVPIAGLGKQSNSTTDTTAEMSGADQFGKIVSGLSGLKGLFR